MTRSAALGLEVETRTRGCRQVLKKLWLWVLDLFFPRKCIFCQRILELEESDVCAECQMELPIYDVTPKSVTGAEACISVFFYEKNVREAILRYKFGRKEIYAQYFGKLMAAAYSAKCPQTIDAITWVPISKERMRERGFNQAQRLAEEVGNSRNLPLIKTLKKTENNPAQSQMQSAAQRRANVRGVYLPVDPQQWVGKQLLLVDDVVTTGSTLAECCRVLLTAGAAGVYCLTLAATRNTE